MPRHLSSAGPHAENRPTPAHAGPADGQPDAEGGGPASQAGVLGRDDADVYARWFQALADSTRIIILSYLSRQQGPVPVGTIATELGIGQSTVSHHLRTLHDVGFVTRTRIGASRLYAVNPSCITRFPDAAEVIMGHNADEPDSRGTR
jgi:ArsR family transcriptional regulator